MILDTGFLPTEFYTLQTKNYISIVIIPNQYIRAVIMDNYKPIIVTIKEEYVIPHFNDTRKISALLPYDYHQTDRRYPVLYLQDGQNLFNPLAPYGDWAIDRSMERLATEGLKDIIIIAIDHGESKRIKEYLPYSHPSIGVGKGKHYIQFLRDKLIPHVNKKYRTLTDYGNTGIGGSSMGGLISLYAGITHPDVFGKMLIFSPSLWISKILNRQAHAYKPLDETMIYLYSGGKESDTHLFNVKRLENILRHKIAKGSPLQFNVDINDLGEHGESYWRQEFPKAISWLFFNQDK